MAALREDIEEVKSKFAAGFALVSFTAVLVYRAYRELGTDDLDEMRRAEP